MIPNYLMSRKVSRSHKYELYTKGKTHFFLRAHALSLFLVFVFEKNERADDDDDDDDDATAENALFKIAPSAQTHPFRF